MANTQFIEIPLPEGARASRMDLELLKAMLHAIVSLHFEWSSDSEKMIQELEHDGWSVHVGPTWLALCRRGESLEQATGRTPDEAIARLYQDARFDTRYGCP
jgi:hypothetical protein